MAQFRCQECNALFEIPRETLDKYPGWIPKFCRKHSPKMAKRGKPRPRAREEHLTLEQVRSKYSGGPQTGVFTDGSAVPNPGPGGWGVVWVEDGEVLAQNHGHAKDTTNNRMELQALIEAYKLLPKKAKVTLYSDSRLCVNTINDWAPKWEDNGWKKKGGEIKNLELVKELVSIDRAHPHCEIAWIAAHKGNLWNEYADSLATAWLRDEL